MALSACTLLHGQSIIIPGNPGIECYKDVIYTPMGGGSWDRGYGLYALDGMLLTPSGEFIGPQTHLRGQFSNIIVSVTECTKHVENLCFYVGTMTSHYGHFMVNTLCRMWALNQSIDASTLLLYHGNEEPEEIFQTGFISDIFSALGLGPDNFVRFSSPTLLRKVVIAYPAFQELSFAFQSFADFFRCVGDSFETKEYDHSDEQPIFLSKREIKSGISGFLNESQFIDSLRNEGIKIVFPELLSLGEQIEIFRTKNVIGGMYGSAFHTSLFTQNNNIMVFNYEKVVWTNQIIIDKLCHNNSLYVYDSESTLVPRTGRYMNNFLLNDPAEIGQKFAREMKKFGPAETTFQRIAFAKAALAGNDRSPEILQTTQPVIDSNRFRFSIVACARWESRFITEWLNYYRALGFEHVFLYCNDDDPRELYDKVLPFTQGESPFVTFRFYPIQGEQLRMYSHFLEHDREKSEWISFFDIDEYLRLPSGMSIGDFVAHFDKTADCILFNWIFFGPDGHKEDPGSSILSDYTRRQKSLHPFTKYVARSKIFTGPKLSDVKEGHGFWHCPIDQIDQTIRTVNVLGEDMSHYYEGFPGKSAAFVNDFSRRDRILETAVMHHYAFRSEKAFGERVKRGLGGAFDGQTTWGKLADGDQFEGFLAGLHEVEDLSLVGFWQDRLKKAYSTNIFGAHSGLAIPISRRKRAMQSSVSQWSLYPQPEADAAGAVNGVVDGQGKFHTDIEDSPWWRVDLGQPFGISEVRLFNRMDQPAVAERSASLAIEIGLDVNSLVEVFRREDTVPFGGVDGKPMRFVPNIPIPGRFVRIRLLTRNFLHLDQVEVYGDALPHLFLT